MRSVACSRLLLAVDAVGSSTLTSTSQDIKGFNYKDMEGLKIEDNDNNNEFDDKVSC
jgi:hypothetical protein